MFFLAAVKPAEATVAFDATGGGNLEVSLKAFAEELKDLADATQVFGSEIGTAEGHVFAVPGDLFHGLHTTVDSEGFEVLTMVRRLALAALSQLALPYVRCHAVWCGWW